MEHDEGTTDDPRADADDGIDVNALIEAASAQIAEQAREHPVRTLGVAFGVGYILGGGLPRFAVRMASAVLLRTAGRVVLSAVPWSRVAEGFVGSPAAGATPAPRPRNGHTRASARRG